jgi:HAMP domain-containing protein
MSDSQVAKHGRAAVGEGRRPWSRGSDPIVQAVGRVPAKVHTKLLIAFVGTSVLLVAVGVLGLRVLGQSNGRVGSLGSLQERVSATPTQQRQWMSVCCSPRTRPASFRGLAAPPTSREEARSSSIGPLRIPPTFSESTAVDRLGSPPRTPTPSPIRQHHGWPSGCDAHESGEEAYGRRKCPSAAGRCSNFVISEAAALAIGATTQIDDLIARNASSYERSRDLFIAVAVGAIVLALVLGFVLAWSVIGPIKRIDARLEAIASGDFSGRVEVVNRDELGALAANVNRMNDELRRLYAELESAGTSRSSWQACL